MVPLLRETSFTGDFFLTGLVCQIISERFLPTEGARETMSEGKGNHVNVCEGDPAEFGG